jgi:hypothetical protein
MVQPALAWVMRSELGGYLDHNDIRPTARDGRGIGADRAANAYVAGANQVDHVHRSGTRLDPADPEA